MKAVVVHKHGSTNALSYENAAKPVVKAGQVLVKNHFIGVNYIDIYQREGTYPTDLPAILGREGSGEVAELGPEVTEFNVGDRVAYISPGAYAEYTAVDARHILKLPEKISLENGAAVLLQGLTAAYLVTDSYKVKPGDFVLVPAAAGGAGNMICQMAANYGATVIGLVSNADKAIFAKQHGAKYVINYTEQDFAKEVMKITNGKGVQVVYDGVGAAIYGECIKSLAKYGHYINFGNASGKVDKFDLFDLTPKCLTAMRPSLFYYVETRKEFLACMIMARYSLVVHLTDVMCSVGEAGNANSRGQDQDWHSSYLRN